MEINNATVKIDPVFEQIQLAEMMVENWRPHVDITITDKEGKMYVFEGCKLRGVFDKRS